MLWWVSWKAWIVSSSPAKRRFSKTLPAWRRSAMPSAMCSRKRWGCGWWMVLFAKTHLSQIVLLRMNCALKAFHFFFSCCFLCLLRPRVRTAVVMKLMMKTNRCCKSNSKLDQHNAEFLLWKYLSWSKSFSVFCGPLLNTMQSKVTIRVCEVFISFFPSVLIIPVDVLCVSGRVWCHAPGVCRGGNPLGGRLRSCRQLFPLPQWPVALHHEQSCESECTDTFRRVTGVLYTPAPFSFFRWQFITKQVTELVPCVIPCHP